MTINHYSLNAALIVGQLLAAVGEAQADPIGASVEIVSESFLSGGPSSTAVTVVSPGVELPDRFGRFNLAENLSINIEAASIELIVRSGFSISSTPFQGLRFTGLNSPGATISGFEVQSSIHGAIDSFDPGAITFGSSFLDVDLQNRGDESYSAGDFVLIELQLMLVIPEPASLLLLGVCGVGALLSGRSMRRGVVRSGLATLILGCGSVQAALIHDYEFNGTLHDELGGPALMSHGGTLTSAFYAFESDEGLSLSGALPSTDNYTIDLSFSFNQLNSFRKIIDFKDLAADTGAYNRDSAFNFYNEALGPGGAFSPGVLARVVLTRDAVSNLVAGYVNGIEQFSFMDSAGLASFTAPDATIHFFRDDDATTGEASSGLVNQIRIYDRPLTAVEVFALGGPKPIPEPAALILLCLASTVVVLPSRSRGADC